MNDAPRSNRHWSGRVRDLRNRAVRQREGVCFVEGIRQVLAAHEGGWQVEAVLLDPQRLRSEVAWAGVAGIQAIGAAVVEMTTKEFERISARDNPAGIAAIVHWQPLALQDMPVSGIRQYVITDDLADAGNLGTLIRTGDSLGITGVITHSGADPAHPAALRASLGTAFRTPIAALESLDDVFNWCAKHGIQTVATSARAERHVWSVDLTAPTALLLGNEGRGLAPETIARCDQQVVIPMSGTATSLNVGVAAGVILYEALRQRSLD